jgi:hypothetical protein
MLDLVAVVGRRGLMRTPSLLTVAAVVTLILGSCGEDLPAVAPDPPDALGVVIDVDSPETVDGRQLLGALNLTLADGSVVEVPRGVNYDGPRCLFVDERGDYGAVREVSECVVHIGMTDGVVDWIRGFRIEPNGNVTPGFGTGDLVEVNMSERFVVTRWGGTFPWRGDPPVIDCAMFDGAAIDDPDVLDHAAFALRFDVDGYLESLSCIYEQ